MLYISCRPLHTTDTLRYIIHIYIYIHIYICFTTRYRRRCTRSWSLCKRNVDMITYTIINLLFFNHKHASDKNPQQINKKKFWTTMMYKKRQRFNLSKCITSSWHQIVSWICEDVVFSCDNADLIPTTPLPYDINHWPLFCLATTYHIIIMASAYTTYAYSEIM